MADKILLSDSKWKRACMKTWLAAFLHILGQKVVTYLRDWSLEVYLCIISDSSREQRKSIFHSNSSLDNVLTQFFQPIFTVWSSQIQKPCNSNTITLVSCNDLCSSNSSSCFQGTDCLCILYAVFYTSITHFLQVAHYSEKCILPLHRKKGLLLPHATILSISKYTSCSADLHI